MHVYSYQQQQLHYFYMSIKNGNKQSCGIAVHGSIHVSFVDEQHFHRFCVSILNSNKCGTIISSACIHVSILVQQHFHNFCMSVLCSNTHRHNAGCVFTRIHINYVFQYCFTTSTEVVPSLYALNCSLTTAPLLQHIH